MHPPSFFSYVTSRRFLPVFVMFVIFFAGVFFILSWSNEKVMQKKGPAIIPTPISLENTQWQTRTSSNKDYSVQYPSNWTQQANNVSTDPVKSFSFVAEGKSYKFVDYPPIGQGIGGESSLSPADKIEMTSVLYGGRHFLRQVFYANGIAYSILANPNEKDFVFDSFSMELPPTHTQKYIDLFDLTLSRLHFSGDLTPPLTPVPTLVGNAILHPQK